MNNNSNMDYSNPDSDEDKGRRDLNIDNNFPSSAQSPVPRVPGWEAVFATGNLFVNMALPIRTRPLSTMTTPTLPAQSSWPSKSYPFLDVDVDMDMDMDMDEEPAHRSPPLRPSSPFLRRGTPHPLFAMNVGEPNTRRGSRFSTTGIPPSMTIHPIADDGLTEPTYYSLSNDTGLASRTQTSTTRSAAGAAATVAAAAAGAGASASAAGTPARPLTPSALRTIARTRASARRLAPLLRRQGPRSSFERTPSQDLRALARQWRRQRWDDIARRQRTQRGHG